MSKRSTREAAAGGEMTTAKEPEIQRLTREVARLTAERDALQVEIEEQNDAFCELRELVEYAVAGWEDWDEVSPFDAEMMALDVWLADTLREALGGTALVEVTTEQGASLLTPPAARGEEASEKS